MTSTPDAIKFWMRQNGHTPATAPAAYFTPDGRPRDVRPAPEPKPEAVEAAEKFDNAVWLDIRRASLIQSMSKLRKTIGTFEDLGPDHVMLTDHERFVKPLSDEIYAGLIEATFG